MIPDSADSTAACRKPSRAVSCACLIALVLTGFGSAVSRADDANPKATDQLEGLTYVETLTAGAESGSELPMLIAMHYMTGSPATSIRDYGGVDVPVRLLSLQGPHPFEDGFSWFPDGYYELDAASQLEVTVEIADRVARFIRAAVDAYPTRGKPILTGYSQGADLTHMIALRQPGLIHAGLPMGGRFPEAWLDGAPAGAALPSEMTLFHGAADQAVDVSESFAAAQYYSANGVTVTLHTYADVGHSYPAQMKRDYRDTVARLVEAIED